MFLKKPIPQIIYILCIIIIHLLPFWDPGCLDPDRKSHRVQLQPGSSEVRVFSMGAPQRQPFRKCSRTHLPTTTQSERQSHRQEVWSSPLFPPPRDLRAWDICTTLISVSKVPGCFMGRIHLHQRRGGFVLGVWTKGDKGNSPWNHPMAEEITSCCLNYMLCEPFSVLTQVIFSGCSETSSLKERSRQLLIYHLKNAW